MLSTKFPYKIWIKISDYYIKVFISLNSFGKKERRRRSRNSPWNDRTQSEQINEFQHSAGIHHSALKLHQVKQKSFLRPLRWRQIQTHTFPWLGSIGARTQQTLGESSPLPTGVQGWEDGEKWGEGSEGKTAAEESKSNRLVLLLSPSANLTSWGIYIKWKSEHHIVPFGSFQCCYSGGGSFVCKTE